MKMNFLRRLALLCAVLTCGMLLALPAAAAEADAPYAEDGDMDYIRSYVVTVDPREDGSVDITYDIDWQVIDGDKTDYLSWVKIGLANSSVDELTPLTDTISNLQYTSDGGSYAKVVFRHRYYAPDVAAANGGESSVHFAFSVHQSHLFTKNDDGTANFAFAPGWFDDLSVENMQVRWHNYDGFVADNTGVDGDYLTWDFGAMGHGQQAMVHVTVPVTNAAAFDPGAAMTTDDYDSGEDLDEIVGMLVTLVGAAGSCRHHHCDSLPVPRVGRRLRRRDRPRRLVLVHERRSHDPLRPLRTPAQWLPPHGPAAGVQGGRRQDPRRRCEPPPQQPFRLCQQLCLRVCVQLRVCLRLCRRRARRVQCQGFLHREAP